MSEPPSIRSRADRILDSAGELLPRFGYRKVTIEDIASRATIGKGTIYLHWRTKETLFEALLLRETTDLAEDLLTGLRRDPVEVLPHRYARASYLIATQRPLTRALLTGDVQLIGKLTANPLRGQAAAQKYFEVMLRHGLLRTEVPNLPYAFGAVMFGFYLVDNMSPAAALAPGAKADVVAHTVLNAFEPVERPSPEAMIAARDDVLDTFEGLIPRYREWIYGRSGSRPPLPDDTL